MPEVGKSLFHSRWKNTSDVYLSSETHYRSSQVPSLVWFCLHCISEFPDQIQLPSKLIYRPSSSPPPKSFRLIDKFLRTTSSKGPDSPRPIDHLGLDLRKLDPRLWAAVIQIFDQIPSELRTYTLSLNDELLPLIQGLRNTDTFSLITILELPGCDALTDDSAAELRCLHTLSALDASNTRLSSRGIVTLARTLSINDPEESTRKLRGPWGLRILRLKHCAGIDNTVYRVLPSFPLLAVIDLRGTKCRPPVTSSQMPFSPSRERKLFSSNLTSSLGALQRLQHDMRMFSAPREYQFILRIKNLCHESVASVLTDMQISSDQKISASSGNTWYDDTYGHKLGHTWGSNLGNVVDDGELSSEGSCEVGREKDEWVRNTAKGLWEPRGDISRLPCSITGNGYSPGQLRTVLKSPPMVTKNKQSGAHQTSLKAFEKPLKRLKLPTSAVNNLESHIHEGCFEKVNGDSSDSESETLTEPGIRAPRRRGLHWYDADLQRANRYVPMSLTKGDYDDVLMLYRPIRSWYHLEKELHTLLEKEGQLEKAQINRTNTIPLINALGSRTATKAQKGLQSMTAFVLQRRQEQILRNKNEPFRTYSTNPFSNEMPQSPVPQPTKAVPLKAQKLLKPITTLKVPKFTQEILEKNKSSAQMSKDLVARETTPSTASTYRKIKVGGDIATEPVTWGLLASPSVADSGITAITFTDRREEHPKQQGICKLNPALTTAFSTPPNTIATARSSSRSGKPKNNSGAVEKTGGSRFNWEAWASKKP